MYKISSSSSFGIWLVVLLNIHRTLPISYNQPKFSSCASWNSTGITFANSSVIGISPFAMFIDANNTLYINNRQDKLVQAWTEGSINPTRILANAPTTLRSLFVSDNEDIYVGSGSNGIVKKGILNVNSSVDIMSFNGTCFSLFIDTNNSIYCAMAFMHQIAKRSLNNNTNDLIIISGTGINGTASDMLSFPCGIFVDINFTLYVADTDNHRIQRNYAGEWNGTTIAGNGASNTATLNRPHAIVLDGDGYLFIIELGSHRLTVSGPNGFQCVSGCNGTAGSASNQFSSPVSLALDSYGNIYVSDRDNNRLQKFILATNICTETTTALQILTSTIDQQTSTDLLSTLISTTNVFDQKDTSALFSSITTTNRIITTNLSSSIFVSSTCSNSANIGSTCNISNTQCDMLDPCQNNSTCLNNNTIRHGYVCICLSSFNGTECQFNHQLCKPNTCWNNGICQATSNKTFNCICVVGWNGSQCEIKMNYCTNIICQNQGVCRSLVNDYRCECLSGSYSGRYCEITSSKIRTYTIVSKSFGYIAIIAITITIIFVIIMDILKYCFNIDPAFEDLQKYRQMKQEKKSNNEIIERIIHINP